ncbi:MAG TPA: mercury methylation corrinoid protein HgcA [Coriobacteriia bacterium]|nr:mercury methylation corrinoid protein HgcA [Coriobacteriia bacterium]
MGDLTGGTLTAPSPVRPAALDVPKASSELTLGDKLGALRMRLNIGRYRYRVEPGLYRLGEPGPSSPVLVTCNYKLTFDVVRSALPGLDAWLLVIDTKGINVWCAAGKGTFGTKELCERVLKANLYEVVDHTTLVLPQLGAPGVAAHEVQQFTGFRVVYGPVRIDDLPAFLDAGMKATPEMRSATFDLRERFVLTGVELSVAWQLKTLAILVAVALASGVVGLSYSWHSLLVRGGAAVLTALVGLLAGAFVTPLLLPWLPFRAFSAKGALVGAVFGIGLSALLFDSIGSLAAPAVALATVVFASYAAMNFTGTSPITSPSGVEHEMRRAIPWQIAGAVVSVGLWIVSAFI